MAKKEEWQSIKDILLSLDTQQKKRSYFVQLANLPHRITYLQPSVTAGGEQSNQVRVFVEVEELFFVAIINIPHRRGLKPILKQICKKGFDYLVRNEDDIQIYSLEVKYPEEILSSYRNGLEKFCDEL
ncbi:MAG: hypothetical protein JJT94_10150 [Bernardetiaceae bacterium]|nr:hypothetical protein [Bernardetiaceae bacterium]